jgi:TRAP-type mannitol/chloroaromatic compound transport system substrate-binding protein
MKSQKLFLLGPVILAAIVAVSLLIVSTTSAADPEVFRLKIQSAYPRGDLSMELLKDFAAAADKRSNGRLKIAVFAAPEIVTFEQLFEATQRGTLDMLHAAGTFWGGIVPVGEIEFGIPYGFKIPEARSYPEAAEIIRRFFFESGFADILLEEYGKHGLHWLEIHTYGLVPFVVATKPIRTCEDLKGVKIRDEGIWTKWHNMVGARGTTSVAPEDTYMGLKLGSLDASQWDVSCITGLKWHEVAPYWIRGEGNDTAVGHILVNMKTWNSLPADLKEALRGAAEDYWKITIDAYDKEMKIVRDMVKGGKVIEVWLDQDCIDIHAEAAYTLWDELAHRDAACAKAIQLIKEWRGIK